MHLRPPVLAEFLLRHLETLEPHLADGALVALTPTTARVRGLPLR